MCPSAHHALSWPCTPPSSPLPPKLLASLPSNGTLPQHCRTSPLYHHLCTCYFMYTHFSFVYSFTSLTLLYLHSHTNLSHSASSPSLPSLTHQPRYSFKLMLPHPNHPPSIPLSLSIPSLPSPTPTASFPLSLPHSQSASFLLSFIHSFTAFVFSYSYAAPLRSPFLPSHSQATLHAFSFLHAHLLQQFTCSA